MIRKYQWHKVCASARPSSQPAIAVVLGPNETVNARGIVNPYLVSTVFDANTV